MLTVYFTVMGYVEFLLSGLNVESILDVLKTIYSIGLNLSWLVILFYPIVKLLVVEYH